MVIESTATCMTHPDYYNYYMRKKRAQLNLQESLLAHQRTEVVPKEVRSKEGNEVLPLFILPDHRIIVFTQSPIYRRIYHHIKAICEPLFRPRLIHQYKITKFSLYTAMVLHYTGEEIVRILSRLSRNEEFPETLEAEIMEYMQHAGKVRFSLIDGQYYLFTTEEISLVVDQFLQKVEEVTIKDVYNMHIDQVSEEIENVQKRPEIQEQKEEEIQDMDIVEESQPQGRAVKEIEKKLIKFRIMGDYFQVTKKLIEHNIPIVQQFDFRHCKELPNIELDMNSDVQLRFYQQAALKNIFIDGRARSGLIILPCGAGKSMVAIQLIQRIKKRAVIFCENQTSAVQWREQFIRWTTIERHKVVVLTSKHKGLTLQQIDSCSVFITTYTMVGLKREKENKFLERTQGIPWGVCVADQVHKLPAETFQLVLQKYRFYLKIGLTATPYREDNKIDNLFYMVGPKLFQENWLDLVNEGCLAKPYCVEVLCPMPPIFTESYNRLNRAELIHTANPEKFKVLQYLIKKHSHFGDKILVFCDRPKILQRYAKLLNKPFIHGGVSQEERLHFYGAFKTIKQFNVLFLSRVGDTAIDLPCANVGIQIGMHYKSRRQEVQRMGRIMRPKDNPFNEFNAFFYTLVSSDTDEADFCRQRQKILIDQGFQHQLKLSEDFDYSGMKIQDLDPKEHLVYVLSQHQQGDNFLNRGQLFQARKETQIRAIGEDYNDYYYEQNDDEY